MLPTSPLPGIDSAGVEVLVSKERKVLSDSTGVFNELQAKAAFWPFQVPCGPGSSKQEEESQFLKGCVILISEFTKPYSIYSKMLNTCQQLVHEFSKKGPIFPSYIISV